MVGPLSDTILLSIIILYQLAALIYISIYIYRLKYLLVINRMIVMS